jgi:hypothetical protein
MAEHKQNGQVSVAFVLKKIDNELVQLKKVGFRKKNEIGQGKKIK